MISQLFGSGLCDFSDYIGKEISGVEVDDRGATISFADTKKWLTITDNGQSCCEHRYMRTDDDCAYHKGASLIAIESGKAAEEAGDDGYAHEICFVDIKTSRGVITVASHNEHNGYYGGFSMVVSEWGE